MPSIGYFEDLYGVTEERALNFWSSHLHETMGNKQWSQIGDSTGVYLASVLGHFCLQSVDRTEALSPDYSPGDKECRECYLMAAVGKRERIMKLVAEGFDRYLFHLANLQQHLRESRYLIRGDN
jgi:hypothetical protein